MVTIILNEVSQQNVKRCKLITFVDFQNNNPNLRCLVSEVLLKKLWVVFFIPQTHETHANNLKVSVNFDNLILTQTYFFAFRCAGLSLIDPYCPAVTESMIISDF